MLLRNGRIVCPLSGQDRMGDVRIEGAEIVEVGTNLAGEAGIDCAGAAILPGFIELNADFADPGGTWREDLRSGAAAAAAGGFTRVVLSPATTPVVDNPSVAGELRQRAAGLPVRVEVAGALCVGLAVGELAEMGMLAEAGCVALSDGGLPLANPRALRRALEYARPFGLPVFLRPGEPSLEERGVMHEGRVSSRLGLRGIPEAAEEIGVAAAISLVRLTGARVHLTHLTTARGLALVQGAQAAGLALSAAVPARSLLLSDAAVEASDYHTATRLLPPLRPASDVAALVAGVAGVWVSADHHPLSAVEKDLEFGYATPGAMGLETAAGALLRAVGDLRCLALCLSVNPGAVLGIRPQIVPGAPADLVVLDPAVRWQAAPPWRSRGCNEPLEGHTLQGAIRVTIARGRIVHEACSKTPSE